MAASEKPTCALPETTGGAVLTGASGAGRSATSWPTAQVFRPAVWLLRSPVAPAAPSSWSATSRRALSVAAGVVTSARAIIPGGVGIAARPEFDRPPTSIAPGTVGAIDGAPTHLEFLANWPPLASTGWPVSTSE